MCTRVRACAQALSVCTVQPAPSRPRSPPSEASPRPAPPQVSELRQQLRLRGLPVSGTKSRLLERMRGGAPSRERPKSRREEGPAGSSWPRLRPKALAAARRHGSVRAGLCACEPMRRRSAMGGRWSREARGVVKRKWGGREANENKGRGQGQEGRAGPGGGVSG